MVKKLKISSGFKLKRLDLAAKSLANTSYLGGYKSAFKGTGLEFEDYRKYDSNSDDASRIDWKASKRVGDLIVKNFKEERNLDIVFLIDVSSHMLTGSTKKLKAEYIAEVISTLSQSVILAGDSVGFTLFSDGVVKEFLPQRGLAQFHALTNELSKIANYGGYGNLDSILNYAYKRFRERTFVILVSDFIKPLTNEKVLKLAAKKFDLLFMMVRDPRDMSLPSGHGQVFLEDPYSGTTLLVDPQEIKGAFSHHVNTELSKLKRLLEKYGADFLYLQTDRPYVNEILTFFKKKEQKWR